MLAARRTQKWWRKKVTSSPTIKAIITTMQTATPIRMAAL